MSWVITKRAVPTPRPCHRAQAKKSHLTDDAAKTLCGKELEPIHLGPDGKFTEGWKLDDAGGLECCGICTKSAAGYTRVARYL